ncbi:MAG TPA: mechanosensitive ion channel family protein [Terriglobia bacterium]|nr:mechanosensitive ion channel family protein [Terriglobia bacterium]
MLQEMAKPLHLSPATFYFVCFFVLLLAAFVFGFILNRIFRSWSKKVHNHPGELLLAIAESLSVPLSILTAVYTALEVLTLPRKYEQIGSKIIFALVVAVTFYFLARVVNLFLTRWGQQEAALVRVTQPASFMVRIIFALLAAIIIFENLGIHLTAVWTTLGVGSVAVALALQETLSNFFAGIYLLADRPVNPNDYIKLDGGQEGYVVRIRWRSTALRMLSNNLVIIPNATLAKAVITNYSMPEERMVYSLPVSVAYGTDPARVEKILLEEAGQAARDGVEGLLTVPEPSVRLIPGFGASSLDFSLNVQVRQFTDQYLVQSELRKRILDRFQKEGIEMPFPTRAVVLEQSVMDSLAALTPTSGQPASGLATPGNKLPPKE